MKILFIIFFFLVAASCGFASDASFSSRYEFGRRQIADLLEERDTLDNFNYSLYSLRLKAKIENSFGYSLSYLRSQRDYQTRQVLDSKTNDYKLGIAFQVSEPTSLDVDFRHKEKRYANSPLSEYNQDALSLSLTHALSPIATISFASGINNYGYLISSNANQQKYFFLATGSLLLLEKNLGLDAFYRGQITDQKGNNQRSEQIIGSQANYKFSLPYFKSINLKFERGQTDTKEIDERDDSLRYHYSLWSLKTIHPLTQKLDTAFTYSQRRRDYLASREDYRNWSLENKTNYEIFSNKASSLISSFTAEHKETEFPLDDSFNYIKNSSEVGIAYKKKKNYAASCSFTFSQYDYPANLERKENDYLGEIELAKELRKPECSLKAKYSYMVRDFRYSSELMQWRINISAEFPF